MTWGLRHGKWQQVLRDPFFDGNMTICTDPPFSARTHAGRRTGSETRKSTIGYDPLTPLDAMAFVVHFSAFKPEWWVIFSDDEMAQAWKHALAAHGQYVFAPIPWVKPDAAPRMTGDGPASGTEWIVVARWPHNPRRMGSRPPHYTCPTGSTRGSIPGAKPLDLMRALVRDYSEPDTLVVDPFAGSGTTLLAAAMEGRDCLGAEMDKRTYGIARRRLEAGYTVTLPGIAPLNGKQEKMFDAADMETP